MLLKFDFGAVQKCVNLVGSDLETCRKVSTEVSTCVSFQTDDTAEIGFPKDTFPHPRSP